MISKVLSSAALFSLFIAAAQAAVDCTIPIDTEQATCGGSTGYRCDVSQCCSQYGYCGTTSDYCSTGCQSGFGTCSTTTVETCAATSSGDSDDDSSTCPSGQNLITQYWQSESGLSQIDWSYTDIAYYFVALPKQTGELENPSGDMAAFVTAAHNHGKKAMLVLGGWTGSQWFSDLSSNTHRRNNFINNVNTAVTKYGFDGVDIDWEYPTGNGLSCNTKRANDTTYLLGMLKRMRTVLGSDKYLSIAVSSAGLLDTNGNALTDYSEFDNVLDFVTLMIYDTYGPGWSATSGPNAPLYNSAIGSSGTSVVDYYISAGFTASKLLLGVPSYAYTFQLRSSRLTTTQVAGIDSQIYQGIQRVVPQGDCYDGKGAGGVDPCTGEAYAGGGFSGTWTYKSMISCGALSEDGKTGLGAYKRYWDDASGTPYLFNSRRKVIIPYEDASSIALKTQYAKSKGLAGIAIFSSKGFNRQVLSSAKAGFQ